MAFLSAFGSFLLFLVSLLTATAGANVFPSKQQSLRQQQNRLLQEQVGLVRAPFHPTMHQNGPPHRIKFDHRNLQTNEEVCTAVLTAFFLQPDDCTCTPSQDSTEFSVDCELCQNVQAIGQDSAYSQFQTFLFYRYQENEYAVETTTLSTQFTGSDRTIEGFVLSATANRVNGRQESCDFVYDGTDCSCELTQCSFGNGLRLECPSFTTDSCEGTESVLNFFFLPGFDGVRYDVCECFDLEPEFCEATLPPFPSLAPFTLPPATLAPTAGTPPVVITGPVSCADTFTCPVGRYCDLDSLSCEYLKFEGELCNPDNFECVTICGRETQAVGSPFVCCPENLAEFDETTFQYFCTSLSTPPPAPEISTDEPTATPGTSLPTQSPNVMTNQPTSVPSASPTGAPFVGTEPPTATPISNATTTDAPATVMPTTTPTGIPTEIPFVETEPPTMPDPTESPTTTPTEAPLPVTSAALNDFVLDVTSSSNNVPETEIIGVMEDYLSERMAAVYPNFARLELARDNEQTRLLRMLQSSVLIPIAGTIFFTGDAGMVPGDVLDQQSAALLDEQDVATYLGENLEPDMNGNAPQVTVNGVTIVSSDTTLQPTSAPTEESPPSGTIPFKLGVVPATLLLGVAALIL